MQDARNAGVCLTLKVYVQTLQRALGFLISDMNDHVWECRRERIHKFATAKRHRKAVDESLQRFHRMTGQIPAEDQQENSVRIQAVGRIADFYNRLRSLLPAVDYPRYASNMQVTLRDNEYWRTQLLAAADEMERLSEALMPLKHHLDVILEEKSKIAEEIELSLQKMAGIL